MDAINKAGEALCLISRYALEVKYEDKKYGL